MYPFLLDPIPDWGIFVSLLFIFFGSVWVGFKVGQRRRRLTGTLAEKQAEMTAAALAAMLTLIGFLLAFSFSLAGSHFDDRRQLVIDDANAIGGAFNGTELLKEPYRSNIQRLLIDYVNIRANFHKYEYGKRELSDLIQRSERLQEQMVVEGSAAANLDPTPVVATFINSLNTMIDIHELRTDLRWNRIPSMIFVALAFLSALAMILVGYIRGLNDRAAILSLIFLGVIYAGVFTLVIDLDRHTKGLFFISQQPMIELRDSLEAR